MSQRDGDGEMEDVETIPGNNVQELETEVRGAEDATTEENLTPKVYILGGADKSENVTQDLNTIATEEKDMIPAKDGLEGQANRNDDEATKPMDGQGSLGEDTNSKLESESKVEGPVAASAVEDVKTDMVEREVKPIENGLEGGNPDNRNAMNENSSRNDVEKKSGEIGEEDGNRVEHVEVEETSKEIAGSGNGPGENVSRMDEKMEDASIVNENKVIKDALKGPVKEEALIGHAIDGITKTAENAAQPGVDNLLHSNHNEAATPNSLAQYAPAKTGDYSGQTLKPVFTQETLPLVVEGDDGTPEEQETFMRELENFHRDRALDFKPPKFYGQPLNCLKLWRAVIRLGGYDRVTGSKLWRQVGESFNPPKTCTTVSWTFRIFYEKSLLEFEKHKRQIGELQLPVPSLAEASGVDVEGNGYQGSGSGRARRDAAARAMQGWHVQRLFGNGEVGEPIIKDKNLNVVKREKNIKNIGSLKQKRPNEVEHPVKAARTETSKQLVTSVVDIGPPADWVKINVRQTKDCFEVYALVPGLLREEVRVQSDPAGRLVITGQPEQADNPWGITPFKKVVSLPSRIDPLQTSAVVSLHGRLFVRVPFEQSNV